jgi:hypothetical protein
MSPYYQPVSLLLTLLPYGEAPLRSGFPLGVLGQNNGKRT